MIESVIGFYISRCKGGAVPCIRPQIASLVPVLFCLEFLSMVLSRNLLHVDSSSYRTLCLSASFLRSSFLHNSCSLLLSLHLPVICCDFQRQTFRVRVDARSWWLKVESRISTASRWWSEPMLKNRRVRTSKTLLRQSQSTWSS